MARRGMAGPPEPKLPQSPVSDFEILKQSSETAPKALAELGTSPDFHYILSRFAEDFASVDDKFLGCYGLVSLSR